MMFELTHPKLELTPGEIQMVLTALRVTRQRWVDDKTTAKAMKAEFAQQQIEEWTALIEKINKQATARGGGK